MILLAGALVLGALVAAFWAVFSLSERAKFREFVGLLIGMADLVEGFVFFNVSPPPNKAGALPTRVGRGIEISPICPIQIFFDGID